MRGYIGTYNSSKGKGIYSFEMDERKGTLSDVESVIALDDAKCVEVINSNRLLTTLKEDGKAGIGIVDTAAKKLVAKHTEEENTPCFIHYENGFIYTANYHDGTVMIYSWDGNVLKLEHKIENGYKSGCHQVILYKGYLVVPCLLLDEVRIFDANDGYKLVKTINYEKGTGPRHGIFNKALTKLYLVSELSNELFIYDVDGLEFNLSDNFDLFKVKAENASSAAIRLSNSEEFLYISTRGADVLTVVELCDKPHVMQQLQCGGSHPRDFVLSKNNIFLIEVNKDTDDIVVWLVDRTSGKLLSVVSSIPVPHGIGISLDE